MAAERKLTIVLEPPPRQSWLDAVEARLTRYTNRADWLKARHSGIGGSEAAILFGATTWGSPYELWAEKAGLVEADSADTEILRFGRVVEPHIAQEYQRLTGRPLMHLGDWAIRQHESRPYMFATHDRVIEPIDNRGPGLLSIKSANVWKGVEWLEYEEPPLAYQVQLQHELACSGFKWGSFAVLIWGKGVHWVDVERNDAFIEALEAECAAFWRKVEEGTPPDIDGSEHTASALRRLYPKDGGARVELPAEAAAWAAEIDDCCAQIAQFEARKDELNNRVRALLKDASEGFVPGGPGWSYRLEGARPGGHVPEHDEPPYPGHRVLRRKGGKKKGRAA